MKKYTLDVINNNTLNVATKARDDADKILTSLGFEKLNINIEIHSKKSQFLSSIKIIKKKLFDKLSKIEPNSVLIIQYPWDVLEYGFSKIIKNVSCKKNIKTVVLIHDLNSYRTGSRLTKFYYLRLVKEFKYLNNFDYIICHNDVMKTYLEQNGVQSKKLHSLVVFDYLTDNTGENANLEIKLTDTDIRKVIVAGNLSDRKAAYLYNLDLNNLQNYKYDLYGPNFNRNKTNEKKLKYNGILPAEKLPSVLNSGFGLVWDGNSIYTCNGAFGNYLRINNPFKLSLYLSSGIPVIVWSQSAVAEFVEKNKLGFVINSLNEIDEIMQKLTFETYRNYLNNVSFIRKKVITGEYLKTQIVNILKDIEKSY